MSRVAGVYQPGETFAGYTDLVVEVCCNCGVMFAMPRELERMAREKPGEGGRKFYCPNGHQMHYVGLSVKEELKRANDRAAAARAERDQAEASARAQRSAATRARNERDRVARRVKAGVCPCCKRSFKALKRHMASQHPEYDGQTS